MGNRKQFSSERRIEIYAQLKLLTAIHGNTEWCQISPIPVYMPKHKNSYNAIYIYAHPLNKNAGSLSYAIKGEWGTVPYNVNNLYRRYLSIFMRIQNEIK